MDCKLTIPPAQKLNYFASLAANRPIGWLIARELEPLNEKASKKIRTCGRYPIGRNPIELVNGPHGLFARGVKWCGSRYCPNCHPRIMGQLAIKRAARARAATAGKLGVAFFQAGQPRGFPGELGALVTAQLQDWHMAFPVPSRAPKNFRQSLPDWIGADWNIEIDWDFEAEAWYVHAHALGFLHTTCTPEVMSALVERWPHATPLIWAEKAENPQAASRYSVKAVNRVVLQKILQAALRDLAASRSLAQGQS